MTRETYLQELWSALVGRISQEELERIMAYYEQCLDEAGPQGEAERMAQWGSPAELAARLAGSGLPVLRRRPSGRAKAAVLAGLCGLLVLSGAAGWRHWSRIAGWGRFGFGASVSTPAESMPIAITEVMEGTGTVQEDVVYYEEWDLPKPEEGLAPFNRLDVDIEIGDIIIVQDGGNYFDILVDTGNSSRYRITYENKDGVLTVRSQSDKGLNLSEIPRGTVYIIVPYGTRLNQADLRTELGSINGECLFTGTLTAKTELGDINLSNFETDSGEISTEKGCVTLCDYTGGTTKVKNELGDIYLSGTFLGETVAETELGAVMVDVAGAREDYLLDLATDWGDISIDGEPVSGGQRKQGSGSNYIRAAAELGDIYLNFGS